MLWHFCSFDICRAAAKGRRSCKELLGYGLSEGKLLECWAYTNHIALNTYINKRGLHQTVEV